MKILVTGATGLIGQKVIENLSKSETNDIYSCSLHDFNWSKYNVKHIECDLLSSDQVENMLLNIKPECIIHLAWGKSGSKCNNTEMQIKWLQASIKIGELFGKLGGKRFIGCGTVNEYATINDERFEEKTPTVANHAYGASKLSLSNALIALSKVYGYSFVWPRVPYVIGKNCSKELLIGQALFAIKQKINFQIGLNLDFP